jgi:hypothetical protein
MPLRLNQNGNINNIESGNIDQSNSLADLRFTGYSNGNVLMTLTSSGNLGIGTTTPKAVLDVIGNINFNEHINSFLVMNVGENKSNGIHYLTSYTISSSDFIWGPAFDEFNPSLKESILNNTGRNLNINIRFTGDAENSNEISSMTGKFYIANSTGTLISTLYEYTVPAATNGGPDSQPGTLSFDSGYISATIPAGGSIRSTDNLPEDTNAYLRVFNTNVYINRTIDIITSTAGNIGIGTTSPSQKLDIVGNLRITGGSLLATDNSNTIGNLFTIGGSVGIGTTNPDNILTIGTSSLNNPNAVSIQNSSGSVQLAIAASSGQYSASALAGDAILRSFNKKLLLQSGSGNSSICIGTSGNIGIGTTAPTTQLTIKKTIDSQAYGSGTRVIDFKTPYGNGIDEETIKASIYCGIPGSGSLRTDHGYLSFMTANTNTLYERLRIDQEGNIGIGTTAPSTRLHVVGSGSGTNGSVLITGNDGYGHSLYIGSAAVEKRLAFSNNGTVGNIFAYNYGSSAAQNLSLQAFGGNVGIGTTNPKCLLHISSVVLSNDIPTTGTGNSTKFSFMESYDGTNGFGLIAGVTANTGLVWLQSKYNNTTGTLPMALQPLGGNLLVGTGNHSYFTGNRLTVRNDCSDAQNAQILIQGLTDARKTMHIGYDTTNNYAFIDSLNHEVAWTNTIFSRNGGNVGIGTSSPAQKLEVAGAIRISTAPSISYDGDASIIFNQSGVGPTIQGYQFDVRTGSATSRLRIDNNGNVGIGTSSPRQALEVAGSITTDWNNSERFIGMQYIDGTAYKMGMTMAGITRNLNLVAMSGDNTGSITFNTGTTPSERMRMTASGNLGIGTSSPFAKLHVEGTVTTTQTDTGYLFTTTSGMSQSFVTGDGVSRTMSIYASSWVVSRSGFLAYSDRRIKEDIQDVNDDSALNIVRQLKPKMYKYVDKVEKGDIRVYGFIAQEVGALIENSTTQSTQYIPNIYKKANYTKTESGKFINFTEILTNLDKTDNATKNLKLYGMNNKLYIVTIKEFVSDTCISIEEDLDETEVVVYGQEVKDFHSLNKDSIFTVTTAALQEVDRQLQQEKAEHEETKQQLNNIKQFLQSKFPGEF